MSDTIDWKARCEAAEAHNIKMTREWSVQVTEMRKELERVQKAAAEMREAIWAALPALRELARGGNQAAEDAAGLVNDAISSDAGRDYHHRDEYKPLVEALQGAEVLIKCLAERCYNERAGDYLANRDNWCRLKDALAEARQKGLIQ